MLTWLRSPTVSPAVRVLTLMVAICGASAIALGAIVVGGWFFQNTLLTRIRPEFAAMQFLTALGLILGGTGLAAIAVRLPRILVPLCGGLLALVGGVLGLEYLTGASLGVEGLLTYFPAMPGEVALRSSPPTAVCFLLVGLAIALWGAGVPGGWRSGCSRRRCFRFV